MKRRVSNEFFAVIDDLAGGGGTYYRVTDPGEKPPVEVAIYSNVPEVGHTTSFTFGLSSAVHPEWVLSRPELLVSVKSMDHAWGLCAGEIVRNYRSEVLFAQGSVLHFRQQISEESKMTSFFIYTCTLLGQAEERITLADRAVLLSQLYPIYEQEAAILERVGCEKFFWDLGIDFYDVGRPPAK